jgi:hypothetical protein
LQNIFKKYIGLLPAKEGKEAEKAEAAEKVSTSGTEQKVPNVEAVSVEAVA